MTPETRNRRHVRILWMLVLLEVAVLARLWLDPTPFRPVMGFLIKSGNSYIVAWKTEAPNYEVKTYSTLSEALQFARAHLALSEGRNPIPDHELEHVWVNSRFGNHVVLWKTLKHDFLNQMTFQNAQEADYFLKAFRRGSYAPSIFGHSVLLVPRESMFN